MVISSFNPLRVWLHNNGVAKFATAPFSTEEELFNADNLKRHVTNQALNKGASSFTTSSDPTVDDVGSRWSLRAFLRYLDAQHDSGGQRFWQRLQDVLVKAVLSVESTVRNATIEHCPERGACFQLLGVDCDVGADLTPIFIEANVNPSLGGSTAAFDNENKRALMQQFFDLIGVQPFAVADYKRSLSSALLQFLSENVHSNRTLLAEMNANRELMDAIVDFEYEVNQKEEVE
jgi:hypothetical protein